MRRCRAAALSALLAVAGALALTVSPASATTFCRVKESADGFVALRAGPGAQEKLVGRMVPDDEVLIGQRRKGNWIEVTWWRGDERLTRGFGKTAGRGWVNRALIEEEC